MERASQPVLCPTLPSLNPMSRLLPIALSHHTDGIQALTRSRPTIVSSFAEIRCASSWHRSGAPRGLSQYKPLEWKQLDSRDYGDPFPCSPPSGSISRRGYRGMTSCVAVPISVIVEARAQVPTQAPTRDKRTPKMSIPCFLP